MKGATIKGSGKSSMSKQLYSRVGSGKNLKGQPMSKTSKRSTQSMGFHAGKSMGSINGSHK